MGKIPIKSSEQIDGIRVASQITADILDGVTEIVQPGVTTEDIDRFVVERMKQHGAIAATLNYKGFPKSCCTSVNDVICHGIPSQFQTLEEGDIINVDVTSIKEGYFGDSSRMYLVGGEEACSEEACTLVAVTKQALEVGMEAVKPGARFGDIGFSIQKYIQSLGPEYGIVREYTGHGIGTEFHEPPQILHFGKKGTGPQMKPGMVFTIEPMINAGTHETVLSRVDGWTVRTADGKLSAQWEHTIVVTEDGFEKLTDSPQF